MPDIRSVVTRISLDGPRDVRSIVTRVALERSVGDIRSVVTRMVLESPDVSVPAIFYGGPTNWIPFRVYLPGSTAWVRIV